MSEVIIYKAKDGRIELSVNLSEETVWLTQKQLSELFDKNVRTISEHIQNIFYESELDENSVIRNFRITAMDGKSYDTKHYNLDVIISVGYRVNSKRGTEFRQWATRTLEERAAHLLCFIIKDHPFSDGNKRIGCLIFLLYLKLQNNVVKLNDNGLIALALLIAESEPAQKDLMIRLIVNLLVD